MNRYVKEAALGLAVFFLTMMVEFVVSVPFNAHDYTVEFLVASVAILAVTYGVALALRTPTLRDGLVRGGIWLAVTLVLRLLLSVGNEAVNILGVPTFYLLLAAVVAGPALAGWRTERGERAVAAS